FRPDGAIATTDRARSRRASSNAIRAQRVAQNVHAAPVQGVEICLDHIFSLLLARRPNKGASLDTHRVPRHANSDSHRRPLTEGLTRPAEDLPVCSRTAPAGVLPIALHQQAHSDDQRNHNLPSPGPQISGMASYENRCGSGPVGRRMPSHRPPGGLPHDSPGAEGSTYVRFHRGLPPSWRVVGLHQIDGTPHQPQRARSLSDPVVTVKSLSEVTDSGAP
ncbi:MAG: hypothetical protein QOE84_347, partial [Actinomycetota bacterium]|nr:hypothetical protein [Actinomycetota bacterium]